MCTIKFISAVCILQNYLIPYHHHHHHYVHTVELRHHQYVLITITWLHIQQAFLLTSRWPDLTNYFCYYFPFSFYYHYISLRILQSSVESSPTYKVSITHCIQAVTRHLHKPKVCSKTRPESIQYIRSHLPWNLREQHQQISWFTWFCFLPVANDFLSMGKGFPARAPLEKKSFLMFISNGEN